MTLRRSRAGLSADGRLKAEDTTPIMFITAFANERIRTQAGAVSSLLKPSAAVALIDGLRQALGTRMPTVH